MSFDARYIKLEALLKKEFPQLSLKLLVPSIALHITPDLAAFISHHSLIDLIFH
jgi:hypothetical protein